MSVKLLFELRERLHYTAIAGTLTAGEDFRLKNVLEQFAQIAGSAPVFAKINELLKPLGNPEGFTGRQLMEAASLVDAVCITQAGGLTKAAPGSAVSFEGVASPGAAVPEGSALSEDTAGTSGGKKPPAAEMKQFKYSEVKPFLDALTSKGSGRYSLMEEAYRTDNPVLTDYRLIPALVRGLNDSYSEMADLCQNILCEQGASIIPFLKEGFRPDGKKDMARRVTVIARVGGKQESGFFRDLIANAKGPVRIAAIHGLVFDEDCQNYLIELAKSERGDAKHAAMSALMKQTGTSKDEFFRSLIQKDAAFAADYLYYMEDLETADLLADALYAFCETHLPIKKELKKEEAEKLVLQLGKISGGLYNKYSPKLFGCYRYLDENKKNLGSVGIKELLGTINTAIEHTLFMRPNQEIIAETRKLGAKSDTFLKCALTAEFIENFAGSYDAYADRLTDTTAQRAMVSAIQRLSYDREKKYYVLRLVTMVMDWNGEKKSICRTLELDETMDIRWFRLITSVAGWDKKFSSGYDYYLNYYSNNTQVGTLQRLMNPEDEELTAYLKDFYRRYSLLGKGENGIEAYLELGGTDFAGMIPALIKANPKEARYSMYRLYDKLPMDPQDIAAELRQIADMIETNKLRGTYLTPKDIREKADQFQKGERSFLN